MAGQPIVPPPVALSSASDVRQASPARSSYVRRAGWLLSNAAADDAGGEGGLLPYRRLALRVIRLAMQDVAAGRESDRQSAERFLCGSPLLSLWCELANLDASRVAAYADRALALRRLTGDADLPDTPAPVPALSGGKDPRSP